MANVTESLHTLRLTAAGAMSRIGTAAAALGGNTLLVVQLVFSVLYISSCELPNWMVGPRQSAACTERYQVVMALLFPSGVGKAAEGVKTVSSVARRVRDEHGRFTTREGRH